MPTKNKFDRELTWIKDVGLSRMKPSYSTPLGAMFNANAYKVLQKIPSSSVDLVMTSPPFALARKKEYGNEPVDRYLEWFMPFCVQRFRMRLSNRSSFRSINSG